MKIEIKKTEMIEITFTFQNLNVVAKFDNNIIESLSL